MNGTIERFGFFIFLISMGATYLGALVYTTSFQAANNTSCPRVVEL